MLNSSGSKEAKNDIFANIASQRMSYRDNSLAVPKLPKLDEIYFNLESPTKENTFTPQEKMSTREQLKAELVKQREYYKPFLENKAPKLVSCRNRIKLEEFDWRKQTEADQQDFSNVLKGSGVWQKVTIPHYGEPLGKAVTYYRTTFQLNEEDIKRGALFVCFKGVDYKAHVFINNTFLGSHEGFFAPFEFDFSSYAHVGDNTIVVVAENDYIFGGNVTEEIPDKHLAGDKLYAATGPGYDDYKMGWHHCPPGMGIYQDVYIESRARLHITDVFVRPDISTQKAEAWLEIYNCDIFPKEITIELSLFGQNFEGEIFRDLVYKPQSSKFVGFGDSHNERLAEVTGELGKPLELFMEKGVNYIRIPFEVKDSRLWELQSPWLYQLQIKLLDAEGNLLDTSLQQFGMRSFEMDCESEIKGAFYLNGNQIRLRGANTMGYEQQDVMKKDWNQLIDDMLLAKICNMNFLRITQRPVQKEIYDYCDKLGLMIQTDLPLFGVLRRNKFCEALRQVEEMEKLIRSHPCCILISYINEPFPNANNKPHRHFTRDGLEDFFKAADLTVHLNNPDRVIKHVDGDYDPPTDGFPDNHCYPMWYNGHGVEAGRLHRGYWLPVKPGWYFGCGEFGVEGLESLDVMKKYYPKEWLPKIEKEEQTWTPNQIVGAQTGVFHYFFFETPHKLEDWIAAGQKHQAWATKWVTEAFRRNERMGTFAIHLFIDAFPSGWMKTIMDVDRNPKPAYFAYREALTPLMVSLRTDRFKFFEKQFIKVETWICNDKNDIPEQRELVYQIEKAGEILLSGKSKAIIPKCSSRFQGFIQFEAPKVTERTMITVRIGLMGANDTILHDASLELEIFPELKFQKHKKAAILGQPSGLAWGLAQEVLMDYKQDINAEADKLILIDDFSTYEKNQSMVLEAVNKGAKAVFLELQSGEYDIGGHKVKVKPCSMNPVQFVARNTGHDMVSIFTSEDFRLWYDPEKDYITPILENTFQCEGSKPILTSSNVDEKGNWKPALAAAEIKIGEGSVIICQVKLAGRFETNPVAALFTQRLFCD